MSDTPAPPSDLQARGPGRKLWREIVTVWTLRPDETALLAEACRELDELEALRDRADGHRKRLELRRELRQTLGQLGLSDTAAEIAASDQPADVLAQARAEREDAASRRARHAAQVRWARERDAAPS